MRILLLLSLVTAACLALDLTPDSAPQWAPRVRSALSRNAAPSPDHFFEFIPSYKATAMPSSPARWESNCFESVNATLEWTSDKAAEVTISVGGRKKGAPLVCQDSYLLAFVGAFDVRFFEVPHLKHTILFNANYSEGQLFDLRTLGLRVFQFPHGAVSTVAEVIDTVAMFVGYLVGHDMPKFSVADNVKFMADHMNYTMEPRKINRVDLADSDVRAGDLLVIIRLDGLDAMIAWGMGSRSGHVAMVIEMEPGVPYVCESNTKSVYWPIDGIQCSKYKDWVEMAYKAQYLVAVLPISDEHYAKFDNEAVVRRINEVYGLPYGIHTFFSGWIDTDEDNYPGELGSKLAMILMQVIEWITDDILKLGPMGNLFAEDMCKRLGKTGLSVADVYMEAAKQGMSFLDLVKIPSQDSWVFDFDQGRKGPSMVCCVFTADLYKHAGLFGENADKIMASEFTNWDVYSLNFFKKGNFTRPKGCVEADPDLPYCQVVGDWRMTLEDTYNSVEPFAHMREKCPSKAPYYIRPSDC